MAAAAFFDLDKTICSRPTESVFGRHLYKHGELSAFTLVGVLVTYLRYNLGMIRNYDAAKRKLIGATFRGKAVDLIRHIWQDCYRRELAGSVYVGMRKCVDDHLAAGREVHVVSASLDFIVREFCKELGIERYHATELEVRGAAYSGEVLGTIHYGRNKGKLLRDLAERSGLDLRECYAYGDNVSDRYMLEAVGNPVAVNPERKLERLARQRGWQIQIVQ